MFYRITSAPKDGVRILVFGILVEGILEPEPGDRPDWYPVVWMADYICPAGTCHPGYWDADEGMVVINVLAWMPIPPAPVVALLEMAPDVRATA